MISLPRNPKPTNKAGEKTLYRELILATPEDSYLRTVLTKSLGFVFGNIDNDVTWPLQEQCRYIEQNIDGAKTQLAKLKTEIAAQEAALKRLDREVNFAKRERCETLQAANKFLTAIEDQARSIRSELRDATK
jgi:septal ring factor EnvC (AmiA/AmiB activator)